MALNRFPARIVSRSKNGGNAVRSIAYIGGQKLVDGRTGTAYDFRRKESRVEFFGIFLPKNSPEAWRDPQRLANEIESREDRSTRPDQAQLLREFIPTFPHELNKEQRRQYVTDYARELQRKGMVVIVANHEPDPHSDRRNFHPHIYLTMREVTPEGFGEKVREWNSPAFLAKAKERWSELGARYLEKAGFKLEADRFRVDHLPREEKIKLAEQRGDTAYADYLRANEPNVHLGPAAAAKMRRGEITPTLGNAYTDIASRNEDVAARRELEKIDRQIADRLIVLSVGDEAGNTGGGQPVSDPAREHVRALAELLHKQSQSEEKRPANDNEALKERLAAFGFDPSKPATLDKWQELETKVDAGRITEKDRLRDMALYLWQEADKERRSGQKQEPASREDQNEQAARDRQREPDLDR